MVGRSLEVPVEVREVSLRLEENQRQLYLAARCRPFAALLFVCSVGQPIAGGPAKVGSMVEDPLPKRCSVQLLPRVHCSEGPFQVLGLVLWTSLDWRPRFRSWSVQPKLPRWDWNRLPWSCYFPWSLRTQMSNTAGLKLEYVRSLLNHRCRTW